MKRELKDLLWSEVAFLTFEINSTLRKFTENAQEYDESVSELLRSVTVHEFPAIVIFPKDCAAGKLVLHLIRSLPFEELGRRHGISMNGKARASLTRLVVDIKLWHEFTVEDIRPVHEAYTAHKAKGGGCPKVNELADLIVTEVIYDVKRLKLMMSNKSLQPTILQHVIDLYRRVEKREKLNEHLKSDLDDSKETIRLLEEGICFAQRNLEASERRVSAQKCQRSKASNRFNSTIDALNLESSSISTRLKKNYGYARMKLTKGTNRLKKEKLQISEQKNTYLNSTIKLAIFEQLRISITKLNEFNSIESIRIVLCTILPLVIPEDQVRKQNSISKSGIAMALGFNEKSLIGKHVFEKSLELHSALNGGTNTVQYIENAVVPITR
jgi:hypothetical protein